MYVRQIDTEDDSDVIAQKDGLLLMLATSVLETFDSVDSPHWAATTDASISHDKRAYHLRLWRWRAANDGQCE